MVILFKHKNKDSENTAIPQVIEATKDKIVFLGNGGCGEVGRNRISILTRVN